MANKAETPKPDDRASAGAHDGKFVVCRPLNGGEFAPGDDREGKVSNLAHLCRTGAILPKDKATADAVSTFTGQEIAVYKAPAKGKEK